MKAPHRAADLFIFSGLIRSRIKDAGQSLARGASAKAWSWSNAFAELSRDFSRFESFAKRTHAISAALYQLAPSRQGLSTPACLALTAACEAGDAPAVIAALQDKEALSNERAHGPGLVAVASRLAYDPLGAVIAKILLDAGSTPHGRIDKTGDTPLMLAAAQGKPLLLAKPLT